MMAFSSGGCEAQPRPARSPTPDPPASARPGRAVRCADLQLFLQRDGVALSRGSRKEIRRGTARFGSAGTRRVSEGNRDGKEARPDARSACTPGACLRVPAAIRSGRIELGEAPAVTYPDNHVAGCELRLREEDRAALGPPAQQSKRGNQRDGRRHGQRRRCCARSGGRWRRPQRPSRAGGEEERERNTVPTRVVAI